MYDESGELLCPLAREMRAESRGPYVHLGKKKGVGSINKSRPGLTEILAASRFLTRHQFCHPTVSNGQFATLETISLQTMHFLHFNSLLAVMVLFGTIRATPVPQGSGLGASFGSGFGSGYGAGSGSGAGVGVGVGVRNIDVDTGLN